MRLVYLRSNSEVEGNVVCCFYGNICGNLQLPTLDRLVYWPPLHFVTTSCTRIQLSESHSVRSKKIDHHLNSSSSVSRGRSRTELVGGTFRRCQHSGGVWSPHHPVDPPLSVNSRSSSTPITVKRPRKQPLFWNGREIKILKHIALALLQNHLHNPNQLTVLLNDNFT